MNRVLPAPAHRMKALAFAALSAALMTPAASCGGNRHYPGPVDGSADGGGPDAGGPPTTFSIGGTVTGLAGSGLVLRNNAADDLTITANGTFVFPARLASGAAFDITVKTQPMAPKQSCVVTGSKGVVANGNITTVVVNCATDTFTVGGTVHGLAGLGARPPKQRR